jgi:hypothetical protein
MNISGFITLSSAWPGLGMLTSGHLARAVTFCLRALVGFRDHPQIPLYTNCPLWHPMYHLKPQSYYEIT